MFVKGRSNSRPGHGEMLDCKWVYKFVSSCQKGGEQKCANGFRRSEHGAITVKDATITHQPGLPACLRI